MNSLKISQEYPSQSPAESESKTPVSVFETGLKIQELMTLEDNWDSYGALSPTKVACVGAVTLAYELFFEDTPIPDVFPVSNGNIQIEWSCYGLDIEVEISSTTHCEVRFEDLEDPARDFEATLTYDFTVFREILRELSAKATEQPGVGLRAIS